MLQKYFAGNLEPWQEKAWKAEDGIFYLVSEVDRQIFDLVNESRREFMKMTIQTDAKIAELTKERNLYKEGLVASDKDCDDSRERIATLKEKIIDEKAISQCLREDFKTLQINYAKQDEQITTLRDEMQRREDYIDGCLV